MIIAFTGAGISKESGIDTLQDRPEIGDKLTRNFANTHPEEYREVMRELVSMVRGKMPNDAHYALAEYDIPIITMNIDGLHEKAGSRKVIALHGRLPHEGELDYCDELLETPVLYGDIAPAYEYAYNKMDMLRSGDIFLIIGASTYTNISEILRADAIARGAEAVEIQDHAASKVREFLKKELG